MTGKIFRSSVKNVVSRYDYNNLFDGIKCSYITQHFFMFICHDINVYNLYKKAPDRQQYIISSVYLNLCIFLQKLLISTDTADFFPF